MDKARQQDVLMISMSFDMPFGSMYYQVLHKCHQQSFVFIIVIAPVQLMFLDFSWFFAIVAGEYQQQQLPNSQLCLRLKPFVAVRHVSTTLSFSLPA
jgi:hypothetical protein